MVPFLSVPVRFPTAVMLSFVVAASVRGDT